MIFLCNEMIYYVLCINSQPLSDVINVYIDAQLMISIANANILRVINHYVYILFLLSTELKRDDVPFVKPCVICETM